MSTVLLILSCLLFFGFLTTGFLCLQYRKELRRFSDVLDAEKYLNECHTSALEQISKRDNAINEIKLSKKQLEEELRSASEHEQAFLRRATENLELHKSKIRKYKKLISRYRKLYDRYKTIEDLEQRVDQLTEFAEGCFTVECLKEKARQKTVQIEEKEQVIKALRQSVLQLEEVKDLQEFGFYRRKYDFDMSEHYQQRLKGVRSQQKKMVKNKTAVTCDAEWHVEGDRSRGREMTKDQIKLLLLSFNGESDAAIAKVSFTNAVEMEKRINRSFEKINNLGNVHKVVISKNYLKLKLEELYLTREHKEKKEEEKEERRRIRMEMREEKKVREELEKEKREAKEEEGVRRIELKRFREMKADYSEQTQEFLDRIVELEEKVRQASERTSRAISRAQLTNKGHVYVVSNTGSFGEHVYKIGMTRRIKEMQRVRELGDASVPFRFDLHAMIPCEDAPDLEKKLHSEFKAKRVNILNRRKEFFRVTLEEIKAAVFKHHGDVDFNFEIEASDYRQTIAHQAKLKNEINHCGIKKMLFLDDEQY